jgi:hypothetical protein
MVDRLALFKMRVSVFPVRPGIKRDETGIVADMNGIPPSRARPRYMIGDRGTDALAG